MVPWILYCTGNRQYYCFQMLSFCAELFFHKKCVNVAQHLRLFFERKTTPFPCQCRCCTVWRSIDIMSTFLTWVYSGYSKRYKCCFIGQMYQIPIQMQSQMASPQIEQDDCGMFSLMRRHCYFANSTEARLQHLGRFLSNWKMKQSTSSQRVCRIKRRHYDVAVLRSLFHEEDYLISQIYNSRDKNERNLDWKRKSDRNTILIKAIYNKLSFLVDLVDSRLTLSDM